MSEESDTDEENIQFGNRSAVLVSPNLASSSNPASPLSPPSFSPIGSPPPGTPSPLPIVRSSTPGNNPGTSGITNFAFAIRTTAKDKHRIDMQVARFVYATNSAFRIVEHAEFIKMVKDMRPGYVPPNRKQIGGVLLEAVHSEVLSDLKSQIENKTVCLSLDGWSNIHNEPVICVCIIDVLNKKTHLLQTIDVSGESHTANHLLQVAKAAIEEVKSYKCNVKSFVTDNAANMVKMRQELARDDEAGIITYGCSAHLLNLFAHDIELPGVKEHIKQVVKYFRNTHFAGMRYKNEGGTRLTLPNDTRWNSLADCLESYVKNWHILAKICSENRNEINPQISSKVQDLNLKNNAEDYLEKLKIVAVALDKVQTEDFTLGEAVEVCLDVGISPLLSSTDKNFFNNRLKFALCDVHY